MYGHGPPRPDQPKPPTISHPTQTPQKQHTRPRTQVFSLDYQVEPPLSAIIHSRALGPDGYARIFQLLWRLKRVEWSLAASWKCVSFLGGLDWIGFDLFKTNTPPLPK